MGEPKTKGMAIINNRNWLDERLGEGWYTRTARAHDPDWPERVLPGEWYSVRNSFFVFARAFEQLEGYQGVEDLMSEATIEVALNDLNGILRAFLWVASPKMFLRTAPKIWATYANFSTIEILSNETGQFVAHISEIPQDVLGWVVSAWHGFLPPALELAGGKNPDVTITERKQTPDADTWEFHYELRYE